MKKCRELLTGFIWRNELSLIFIVTLLGFMIVTKYSMNIINGYADENRLLRAIVRDQKVVLSSENINFTSAHELTLKEKESK